MQHYRTYKNSKLRPETIIGMMNINLNDKNSKEVINLFNTLLKEFPESSTINEAFYISGQNEYLLNNYEKSIEYMKKVTTTTFKRQALITKARSLKELHRNKEALQALDEVFKLPTVNKTQHMIRSKAYYIAGEILKDDKRVNEAIKQYEKVKKNLPFSYDTWITLAWLYLGKKEYDTAYNFTNKITNGFEPDKKSQYYLEILKIRSACNYYSNNIEDAVSEYEKIVAFYSHDLRSNLLELEQYISMYNEQANQMKRISYISIEHLLETISEDRNHSRAMHELKTAQIKLKFFNNELVKINNHFDALLQIQERSDRELLQSLHHHEYCTQL